MEDFDENTPAYMLASLGMTGGSAEQRQKLFDQGYSLMEQANKIGYDPAASKGALDEYAKTLGAGRSQFDKALPIIMAGLGAMDAGGKRGATLLGSIGSGGKQGIGVYADQMKEQRENDAKLAQLRYQIANAGQDRALKLMTTGTGLIGQAARMKDDRYRPVGAGGMFDTAEGKIIPGLPKLPESVAPGHAIRDPQTNEWIVPNPKIDEDKEHWSIIADEEAKRLGLSPLSNYQRSSRGEIKAVPGKPQQSTRYLSPEEKKAAGFKDDDVVEAVIIDGVPKSTRLLRKGQDDRISPTLVKELSETDDLIVNAQTTAPLLRQALDLNKTAFEGALAAERARVIDKTGIGNTKAARDTLELENNVLRNALGQLKAIFGGAPTEGERAMLLQMESAINSSKEVRERTIKKALQMVEAKQGAARRKAAAIRAGHYTKEDYDPLSGMSNRAEEENRKPTEPKDLTPAEISRLEELRRKRDQ